MSVETNCRPSGGAGGWQDTEHGGVRTAQPHHSTGVKHGQIQGNVWRKRLCASKHFLRKPPAIAVDLRDLERAEACGVELLSVEDMESGKTYLAALSVIRKHGLELDRGFGLQVALPLRWWASSPGEALRLGQAEAEAETVQLGLGMEVGND